VKPEVLVSAKSSDVDLNDEETFIEHQNIYLGGTTKAMLNKLLNEGDITETKYKSLLAYMLGKFPLREELIQNAVWINMASALKQNGKMWSTSMTVLMQYFMKFQ